MTVAMIRQSDSRSRFTATFVLGFFRHDYPRSGCVSETQTNDFSVSYPVAGSRNVPAIAEPPIAA
jgi:hypothetical protein